MAGPNDTTTVQTRVNHLEERMKSVEGKVESLADTMNKALLGTLDGKPGIVATLHQSLEASRINTRKLEGLGEQVEGLKLNWAKVVGIVCGVSGVWGVIAAIFKIWK